MKWTVCCLFGLLIMPVMAAELPLQCATSTYGTVIFDCGDGTVYTPGDGDDTLTDHTCVAPDGYAFGGWKYMDGLILNIAVALNNQDMEQNLPPYVYGSPTITAHWVKNIDVDAFDVHENVLHASYNYKINRVYYAFPSGGATIKAICSSATSGDGSISVSLAGNTTVLPTASRDFDLSDPGDNAWLEMESPYVPNGNRVLVGPCSNWIEMAVYLPLMGYEFPEYKQDIDKFVSKFVSALLGK